MSFEDRQDLLEHRSGQMTRHYRAVELRKQIEATNTVSERNGNKPGMAVLRRLNVSQSSRKAAHNDLAANQRFIRCSVNPMPVFTESPR